MSAEQRRCYRLSLAFEEADSQTRSSSTIKLFEFKDSGVIPVTSPEALINENCRLNCSVFTDGDRALSFIEADVALSTKRERAARYTPFWPWCNRGCDRLLTNRLGK